jgi:hypothetical protein
MLGTGDRFDAEAYCFAGITDPSGKIAVMADATETNGTTHIGVAAICATGFKPTTVLEEVSTPIGSAARSRGRAVCQPPRRQSRTMLSCGNQERS